LDFPGSGLWPAFFFETAKLKRLVLHYWNKDLRKSLGLGETEQKSSKIILLLGNEFVTDDLGQKKAFIIDLMAW